MNLQWSLYFTTLYFKTTLDYKTAWFGPKGQFSVLNDLYIKTTCNIRPHFLGPIGGLKIEGPLYRERPTALRDHIIMRNGSIFQDRFYCTAILWWKLVGTVVYAPHICLLHVGGGGGGVSGQQC